MLITVDEDEVIPRHEQALVYAETSQVGVAYGGNVPNVVVVYHPVEGNWRAFRIILPMVGYA